MAVYFAPQRTPWWAGPLGQLITGQIDAMMDRTKEAKNVEARRGFAGAISQLAQEHPEWSGSQLHTQGMALPEFARAGEYGEKMLGQLAQSREMELAKANMFGDENDPNSGMFKKLYYGNVAGIKPEYISPKLESENLNLGDRTLSRAWNPHTGQTVSEQEYKAGVEPGVTARLAQELGIHKDKMGLEGRKLNKTSSPKGVLRQNKDGEYIYVYPNGKVVHTGEYGQLDKKGTAKTFGDMDMDDLGKALNEAIASGDSARARAIRTTMVNNDPAAFMPPGAYEKAIRQGDSPEAIKAWILKELPDDF